MNYLIAATFFSGLTFFMVKLVSGKVYPLIGNILSISVAFLLQSFLFFYLKSRGTEMYVTREGAGLSIVNGVLVALYTLFLFFAFSKVDVSKATPILYLGSLAIATVLGVFFLKEHMSALNWSGLLLAFVSIFLLLWK